MPFDLIISFEFLCAFVVDKALTIGDPDPPRDAVVLLRDLTSPDRFVNAPREDPEPHIAHLQFDGRNRKAGAHDRGIDEEQGDAKVIFLQEEDVTIHPDGKAAAQHQLSPRVGKPVNEVAPTPSIPEEQEYLWWVAAMDRFLPRRSLAKASLLQDPPVQGPKLAGRVRLGEGDLFSGRLTPSPWTLGGSVSQRLSLAVLLKIQCQQFVEFRCTPFGSPDAKVLRLEPLPGPKSVVAYVRNSEAEHIFGDKRLDYAKRDLDFEYYYDLSATDRRGLARPIPIPLEEHDGSHSACSPIIFSGTQ